MNYKGSGKVHFGVDDVSLYGTPKEELGPGLPGQEVKQSFLKNQLQALFQPTDNKLAMKLFGSKKALMKERIRQKAAGHWVIHPCSSFRWVRIHFVFPKHFHIARMLFVHPPIARLWKFNIEILNMKSLFDFKHYFFSFKLIIFEIIKTLQFRRK